MIDHTQFQDKKIAYHTLGCKLNFAETSSIVRSLHEAGFRKAKPGEQADLCIINTCSVTDMADKKCRQAITRFIRLHPTAFVIVTGCYAQLKPNEIASIRGVDLVLGANDKFNIELYINHLEKKLTTQIYNTKINTVENFYPSCSSDDRTRFFLKVQDGCDYYCTYCTIPYARGKSRSGTIAQTVELTKQAINEGAKEIVLTGVNTGDFGKNNGESFFELIQAIDKIEANVRYRISSIEPNLLTDEIILFVANSKHFAPHFHIPLQSGSNEVLQLMKRRYTRELFAQKIQTIKTILPHAFIGVDVIVGTRGEKAAYFEDARQFIESLDISQLHVFSYSERAGTKALEIEQPVSLQDKRIRSEILHAVSDKKIKEFYLSQIGKQADVLWESTKKGKCMHGFTENYIRVIAPYNKDLINTLQTVTLMGFSEEDNTFALTVK
ncbi:MAG: tRNA (N(6)-L-threonylcarbamoyladenosine(37)-C(2))-methylthiotransferase MtaB [Paludibacteraceae bacterium]|nr:tRNA (N(6)-L-threonylcarbamoyladenosine(37)-C(2))-methylthiotransferase MtaB [Paludibacteraceae bacterium]MBN2788223.1 tRNA (N(6)-L-threonylcarbamoyladenosine(37)-C(2))-methylthiotransferase MtaB [Paludibacteraceae bacterium]